MGFKSSKIDISSLNLNQSEINYTKTLYFKYLQGKIFNTKKFQSDLFLNLPVKIFPWINQIFQQIKENKELNTFESENYFIYFVYLLTNYHTNDADDFSLYYRRSIFITLYDMCSGSVGEYDKNKKINVNIIKFIISFAYDIFQEQHKSFAKIEENASINNNNDLLFDKYIVNALESYFKKSIDNIKSLELDHFLKEKFYNFDAYIRLYFKSILLNVNSVNFNSALPVLNKQIEFPFELYFIYCLSNPLIFGK